MQYEFIQQALFMARPNRFIANVKIGEHTETVHVKNTGRCRELLLPGAEVYLTPANNPGRKTAYDLVAVKKGRNIINMDATAPNEAVKEWLLKGGDGLFSNLEILHPEYTHVLAREPHMKMRADFMGKAGGKPFLLEVKGVTLEKNGVAMFPDAPTERGIRHIAHLMEAHKEGWDTYLFFLLAMENMRLFRPNEKTHPEFAQMLVKAEKEGVHLLAYGSRVSPGTLDVDRPVPIQI